jgi:hypothetical protein
MTLLLVLDAMAPGLRRYVANNGRIYTTHTGQTAATPKPLKHQNPTTPKKTPDPAHSVLNPKS